MRSPRTRMAGSVGVPFDLDGSQGRCEGRCEGGCEALHGELYQKKVRTYGAIFGVSGDAASRRKSGQPWASRGRDVGQPWASRGRDNAKRPRN